MTSWEVFDPTNWTRRLVPSVETFLDKGGGLSFQLDYWVTQLFTSHGSFESCDDCGGNVRNDAEHVLITCSTYEEERQKLSEALGAPAEASNLVALVTKSAGNWAKWCDFVHKVMKDRATKGLAKEKEAELERIRTPREEAARKDLERRRKMGKRKGNNNNNNSSNLAINSQMKKRRLLPLPP